MNLWGVAAVMLAILFVLMPGPPVDPARSVDLALAPHSSSLPGALKDDAIRVRMDRDGTVYLGDRRVTIRELSDAIREAAKNGAEKRVYLSVDAHAKYADAERVLDEIRQSGLQNVSLMTEKPAAPNTGRPSF